MMKKLAALSALMCCLVSLTGCEDESAIDLNITVPEPMVGIKDNDDIYIWTDEETGVQYVVFREKYMDAGFGGITPRLNADGSLYAAETTEPST